MLHREKTVHTGLLNKPAPGVHAVVTLLCYRRKTLKQTLVAHRSDSDPFPQTLSAQLDVTEWHDLVWFQARCVSI